MTDSGGIQEEAPSLGKPVIVLRDTTERPEGVEAGTLKLAGVDEEGIYDITRQLLVDSSVYNNLRSQAEAPEGYAFKSEPDGNVTSGATTTLNLQKALSTKYQVKVQFEGEDYDKSSQTQQRQGNQLIDMIDFSDYCDVNMNPYNFFNEKHFTYATSDLMIRTVFGAEKKEDVATAKKGMGKRIRRRRRRR